MFADWRSGVEGTAAGIRRRPLRRRSRNVGIIGAGMMGISIAAAHVEHQIPVVISDVNRAALVGAAASIAADLPAADSLRPASRVRIWSV